MKNGNTLILIHPSGTGSSAKLLLSWLEHTRANDRITVVSPVDCFSPEDKRRLPQVAFQEFDFPSLKGFISWLRFFARYRARSIVCIDTSFPSFGLTAVFAAWLASRGSVYVNEHLSGDLPAPRGLFGTLPHRLRAAFARRIVAVNAVTRETLINQYSFPQKKTDAVYAPVDARLFAPRKPGEYLRHRHRFGIPQKATVLITVSRLTEAKAVDVAITAFAMLLARTKRTDLWLWIAGEGPLKEDLQRLALGSGAGHRVIFLDHQANVAAYLRESDFFVLTSVRETFGISILEAMNSGLTCVTTPTMAARELLPEECVARGFSARDIFERLAPIVGASDTQRQELKQRTSGRLPGLANRSYHERRALHLLNISSPV